MIFDHVTTRQRCDTVGHLLPSWFALCNFFQSLSGEHCQNRDPPEHTEKVSNDEIFGY